MTRPLRLAIVGCGQISTLSHVPAALSSSRIQLVALVDPMLGRAREVAREYGLTVRVTAELRDVLSDLDGAVIATPNHTHRDVALTCLEAGVHVLIEKPLATSVREGEEIVEAAERQRATVAVGYCTRFNDSVMLMGALLRDGYFGPVHRFAYQFGTVGGWSPLSGYILDRRIAGGGVLVVTGTHFLDRMLHWFGYPDSSEYWDDSRGGPEANAYAVFHYTSGSVPLMGSLRLSKTVFLKAGFVMETKKGRVVLHEGDRASILFRPVGHSSVEHVIQRRHAGPPGEVSPFVLQLEDFASACQQKRPPMVSAGDGVMSLRLIRDLYGRRQSGDAGSWSAAGARP